jgi:hypothetical protein
LQTKPKKLFSSKTMPGGKALWLPYIPGDNYYTTSRGMDIISGSFSGYIMAAYNKSEGGHRICHVSTFGDNKYDCKKSWEVIRSGCFSYVSFRPYECATGLSKGQMKKWEMPWYLELLPLTIVALGGLKPSRPMGL